MPQQENIIHKLRLIFRLIRTTPRYSLILFFQLVSGAASIVGLPLLLPVLNYMSASEAPVSQKGYLRPVHEFLIFWGIEPNFYSLLIVAAVLILTGQCLVFFSSLLANNAQTDTLELYRRKIFTAYSRADWLWLCDNRSGEMNYTVLREADLASVAHLNAQRVLIYSIQVAALLFVTIKLSFPITVAALAVYGLMTYLSTWNSSIVQKLAFQWNEKYKEMSNEFVSLQQNKKFLKTSLLNAKSLGKIFRQIRDITENIKTQNLRIEMQHTFSAVVTFLFLVGLMFFHPFLGLGYSELFLILFVFLRLAPQFASLATAFVALDGNIPMYRSMHQRLDSLQRHEEKNGTRDFDARQTIRFNNVQFGYPNGKKVFSHLTLTIEPQRTTAFIGSSGAGKSTFLDLMLGLLTPQGGTIFYGEVPHGELNKDSLRSKVAYVSQETTLIDASFKENLFVGSPFSPGGEWQNILRKVGLDEVVRQLPEGLETLVGENGIKLSGGQRQRVALARAMFMNPKILILDEATSNLDAQTEALIQETIRKLKSELTIIIVTHRLSSVRIADKIYVLEGGDVVESGNFQELLAQEGRFHLLNSLQSSYDV